MEKKGVYNENLSKIRELTINMEFDEYANKSLVKKLKKMINDGEEEISSLVTSKTKAKYYEKLCLAIMNVLNNHK